MIRVRNLTKKFNKFCAVDKLSFDVDSSEIFGFIGPNGAGKTTTIRMLVTLLEPDEGTAWIDGFCVRRYPEKVRHVIGYMPDYYGVYDGVTVQEYLDFFARSYRIYQRRQRRTIIEDCMALTDLGKIRNKLVSTLSKGMKQRLCLAKTLLHDPKVLVLDEPAAGLDPRARVEFRSLLKELRDMGKTIFISSHILTELSDIVTSLVIVEKGKGVVNGKLDDISQALSKNVNLNIKLELHTPERVAESIHLLEGQDNVHSVKGDGKLIDIEYGGEQGEIYKLMKPLLEVDVPIVELSSSTHNLEEIFMQLTQGEVS